jgi:hypothetical protein
MYFTGRTGSFSFSKRTFFQPTYSIFRQQQAGIAQGRSMMTFVTIQPNHLLYNLFFALNLVHLKEKKKLIE